MLGCIDSLATNFNPSATLSDGTCTYPLEGCTDPTALNYDANATVDDGSWDPRLCGCMDSTATNYLVDANSDGLSCGEAASCTYPVADVLGCMDGTSDSFDSAATTNNQTACVYPLVCGCRNPAAFNFDPSAWCLRRHPSRPRLSRVAALPPGQGPRP